MPTRRRQNEPTCCRKVWHKMSRVKKLEEPDESATQLNRCLGTRDAILLDPGWRRETAVCQGRAPMSSRFWSHFSSLITFAAVLMTCLLSRAGDERLRPRAACTCFVIVTDSAFFFIIASSKNELFLNNLFAALGAMVGSGGYVLEGVVVKDEAGPVAILCFLVSGLVTMMAAFCFAEFGVLIPRAGSAYVYAYVTLGEFWAFLVGWSLLVSTMTATVPLTHTFTGYVDDLANHWISNGTEQVFGTIDVFIFGRTPDILAAVLCVLMIVVKTGGVHSSSKINNIFTVFNMSVLTFVIVFGFYLADFKNWTDNFAPFGISGFLKGNPALFYVRRKYPMS
ncbi:unnamed protein product [Notodromas monacha]|uniref:Uncharacterized protein n=1 Tax=Notodromas monacha TaxID=399045 RepID=A0A7R9C0N6_9CRUS|nr:unnamed protein product [Notodromas monacha]CAG0923827.1 unnamed protein product [Notodromas monacha]